MRRQLESGSYKFWEAKVGDKLVYFSDVNNYASFTGIVVGKVYEVTSVDEHDRFKSVRFGRDEDQRSRNWALLTNCFRFVSEVDDIPVTEEEMKLAASLDESRNLLDEMLP